MRIRKPSKVVVIGQAAVGKTSIINSYKDKKFLGNYKATIGADFIQIDTDVEGKPITLEIIDTAGQERFRSLSAAFYRACDCCVIVYDITDLESFKKVQEWMDAFIEGCGPQNPSKYPFILIGNKIDLEEKRKVPKQQIDRFLMFHQNFTHLQVSAKNQTGLQLAISKIAQKAIGNIHEQIFQPIPIKIRNHDKNNNKSKSRCCQ